MKRPKIKLLKNKTDIIIEIIGQVLLFSLWAIVITNYVYMSNTIPTHYGAGLKADHYGHKSNTFILIGVLTIIYIGMSILERFPHVYNYPVKITDKNYEKLYVLGVRMIKIIKIIIVLIMGYGVLNMVRSIYTNTETISPYYIAFSISGLIFTCIYFMLKMSNIKN